MTSLVFCAFVFEIYPARNATDLANNTRIGFSVDSVDGVVDLLREIDAVIVSEPKDSEWSRRAVAHDFDGHIVELLTPSNRHEKISSNTS